MTRTSLLRENDVIVYSIKERWLISVTSFNRWKQRHFLENAENAVKFGRYWIILFISFQNVLRKFKLLNYSDKMLALCGKFASSRVHV